MITFEAY